MIKKLYKGHVNNKRQAKKSANTDVQHMLFNIIGLYPHKLNIAKPHQIQNTKTKADNYFLPNVSTNLGSPGDLESEKK